MPTRQLPTQLKNHVIIEVRKSGSPKVKNSGLSTIGSQGIENLIDLCDGQIRYNARSFENFLVFQKERHRDEKIQTVFEHGAQNAVGSAFLGSCSSDDYICINNNHCLTRLWGNGQIYTVSMKERSTFLNITIPRKSRIAVMVAEIPRPSQGIVPPR